MVWDSTGGHLNKLVISAVSCSIGCKGHRQVDSDSVVCVHQIVFLDLLNMDVEFGTDILLLVHGNMSKSAVVVDLEVAVYVRNRCR